MKIFVLLFYCKLLIEIAILTTFSVIPAISLCKFKERNTTQLSSVSSSICKVSKSSIMTPPSPSGRPVTVQLNTRV